MQTCSLSLGEAHFEKGTSPRPPPRKLQQLGITTIIKSSTVYYLYKTSVTIAARRFTRVPFPEQRLNACELYCFFRLLQSPKWFCFRAFHYTGILLSRIYGKKDSGQNFYLTIWYILIPIVYRTPHAEMGLMPAFFSVGSLISE